MSKIRNGGHIYLNKPAIRNTDNVIRAIEDGHLCGNGEYTHLCEEWLSGLLRSPALLTSSCTSALEMAALLLDIKPGDEVIVPSFTFPSTANAFVLRGATPVFCDIRPDTLNLDESKLEGLITERTRAIVPVHYAGVGCDMDSIMSHGLPVVEDNAHGPMGTYQDMPLGAIGTFGCLSFHSTKNFTSGEGGALVVNNMDYLNRAFHIREKGTNRQDYLDGMVDKYYWVDVGSSCLMSELQAALLWGQFLEADRIHSVRRAIWCSYLVYLASWAKDNGVGLPGVPVGCEPAYHIFYLLLPDQANRERLQKYLAGQDIQSATHFQPLHSSPMGQRWPAECPVTEGIAGRLLRLPLYADLSPDDVDRVIEAINEFRCA